MTVMQDGVLLETQALGKKFGGLVAVEGVSLRVAAGQIHALIGPNGAGKTTILNLLTRIVEPSAGSVRFDGHDMLHCRPHDVVGRGLSRIFQHMELFPQLTAIDNVLVGAYSMGRTGFIHALLASKAARNERMELLERARQALDYVGLGALAEQGRAGFWDWRVPSSRRRAYYCWTNWLPGSIHKSVRTRAGWCAACETNGASRCWRSNMTCVSLWASRTASRCWTSGA